jgi:uncharacterized protein YlaN (UPF0358 family)
MTDWALVLIQLRKHYKPLAQVAREIGMSPHRLQTISQRGCKNMLYENGKKLVDLHNLHVKKL